ncbi:MAG: hypothetical protein GPOALKHO_000742 [Sodalis sp.]|nr:MAG: hypothetical protein GPOALKHO_000742 [Sodalis sp.]
MRDYPRISITPLVTLLPLTLGQEGICTRCLTPCRAIGTIQNASRWGSLSARWRCSGRPTPPLVNMEVSGIKQQITLPQIPLVMVGDHFSYCARRLSPRFA